MSYFESFSVGEVIEHRRGRTLSQEENARWSLMTMNTAQAHWNLESMKTYLGGEFAEPLLNAAIVLTITVGLTAGHFSLHAYADVRYDELRIVRPVFAGDTLTAKSTVLELADHAADARFGQVRYRIEATNQRREPVCTLVRTLLVKRKSHWESLDREYTSRLWPDPR